MRDATDKLVDEAGSERNQLRTVLLKKPQEKRVLLNWLIFRPSFLAAASLAENMTLLALLTSLQHVSIRDTNTTLSEKNIS